jgi:hypothetical protein
MMLAVEKVKAEQTLAGEQFGTSIQTDKSIDDILPIQLGSWSSPASAIFASIHFSSAPFV